MRRTIFLPLLSVALLCGQILSIARAAQTNEAPFIQILQSTSSTTREKAAACAQLKLIGTEQSVDALAALLTNEELSHSARYVLESMPSAKAGKALRRALRKTAGSLQIGIINSLGIRHESAAVQDLGKLLSSHDQNVAVASAEALGRIGGSTALKRLQASATKSSGALHQAGTDAILMCATHLLDAGDSAAALKIFEGLYKREKAETVRQAAFGGMILASGERGVALVTDAILNGDAASRATALHFTSQLKGAETTKTLADLAVGAKAPVQIALIECLVQRGDPAAGPAIMELTGSGDAAVSLAAIISLGSLGNESSVGLLVEKASTGAGAERKAARESLLEVNHGPVTQRMLGMLDPASPKREFELILALGGRGDQSATPALLNLARQGSDSERAASLQALGQLADASRIPQLVQLVADAGSDDLRSGAADALSEVCQRIPAASGKPDVDALVKAVAGGSVETRLALLPICSSLPQEAVRGALRAAVTDGDTRIRDAAIHALCETRDPELLPDLLELAGGKSGDSVRHLAIRGCVRLTSEEEGAELSNEKKIDIFTKILGGQLDAGEKRLVLSGVAGVDDERALKLASQQLDDAEVRAEAEQAVIRIAGRIHGAHPAAARGALKKVVAETKNADNRKSAQNILGRIK